MSSGNHLSRHHGVLGTVVEIEIATDDSAVATTVTERILQEIDRLERIFSIFDTTSEIRRWQRGETGPGRELSEVLALAAHWQQRSNGAFNPVIGELMDMWDTAAAGGSEPASAEVARAVAATSHPRYEIQGAAVVALGPLEPLNLNALAKGWIVDSALSSVVGTPGTDAIVINAGGDLLHRGTGSVTAGIENPHRPYDNEPPLTVIDLSNAAIATSGSSRRGWRIAGKWFGHVIDPRTGYPVDEVRSASVVAPDATTADVVATILTVLRPDDGLAFADQIAGLEALLVTQDRSILQTSGWQVGNVSR